MDTFEDSRSGASDRFEAFHEQAGIPSIQLNVVLATMASALYNAPEGLTIGELGEWLGHKDLRSTQHRSPRTCGARSRGSAVDGAASAQ